MLIVVIEVEDNGAVSVVAENADVVVLVVTKLSPDVAFAIVDPTIIE